jgi:hypothetical protein
MCFNIDFPFQVTALHEDPSRSRARLRLHEALNCDKYEVSIFFKIHTNKIIPLYAELHEYVPHNSLNSTTRRDAPLPNCFSLSAVSVCCVHHSNLTRCSHFSFSEFYNRILCCLKSDFSSQCLEAPQISSP